MEQMTLSQDDGPRQHSDDNFVFTVDSEDHTVVILTHSRVTGARLATLDAMTGTVLWQEFVTTNVDASHLEVGNGFIFLLSHPLQWFAIRTYVPFCFLFFPFADRTVTRLSSLNQRTTTMSGTNVHWVPSRGTAVRSIPTGNANGVNGNTIRQLRVWRGCYPTYGALTRCVLYPMPS